MSCDLAETCVFVKQSPEPLCCNSKQLTGQALHRPEHPFFRRYGANWSSSLRMVLPSALEYSSHPPVSVYGTDTSKLTRGFSWQCGIRQSASPEGFTSLNASEYCSPDFPGLPPARLAHRPLAVTGWWVSYPPASPHRSNACMVVQESLCLLAIAYAFRPRLRIRLTPGGLSCPGNPWIFGEQVFHLFCRY